MRNQMLSKEQQLNRLREKYKGETQITIHRNKNTENIIKHLTKVFGFSSPSRLIRGLIRKAYDDYYLDPIRRSQDAIKKSKLLEQVKR